MAEEKLTYMVVIEQVLSLALFVLPREQGPVVVVVVHACVVFSPDRKSHSEVKWRFLPPVVSIHDHRGGEICIHG